MEKIINDFIKKALDEDIGSGDITSIACVTKNSQGKVELITKEDCQIAGIEIARKIYSNLFIKMEIVLEKTNAFSHYLATSNLF